MWIADWILHVTRCDKTQLTATEIATTVLQKIKNLILSLQMDFLWQRHERNVTHQIIKAVRLANEFRTEIRI